MNLTLPPEPKALKKQLTKQIKGIGSKIDSLTVWFGNKLPSYLWKESEWSRPLKKEGYNWQSFLKLLSLHKKDMIKWSNDTMSWRDLLFEIEKTIKDPLFKKILTT